MSRPSLSYANVMSTIAVFIALGGGAWAATGLQSSSTSAINACVKKKGAKKGQLRIVSATATCKKSERALSWTAVGTPGPIGPKGDKGDKGDQGIQGLAGSPDTPAQILGKLLGVDGSGSGLDASLLDGHDSSYFLPTTGKAADANLLDGINSSSFARKSTSSSASIALGAVPAHSCADVDLLLGGVDPGDFVIVQEAASQTLPAGLVMNVGRTPTGNQVHARFCNVLGAPSVADANIPIRWYAFTP
jgi:hypothetical protein